MRIHETFGEDSWGFARLRDFGTEEDLGEDS